MRADVLACYPTTWLSYLIWWVTKKKITHVAIVIDEEHVMETSAKGIKISHISSVGKYKRLRCVYLDDVQREKVLEYVVEQLYRPYDYILILNIFLERTFNLSLNWDNPNKLICVELVVNAFDSVGIKLFPDIEDDDIIPGDFEDCKEFTLIEDTSIKR